jgi:hypothetical protein
VGNGDSDSIRDQDTEEGDKWVSVGGKGGGTENKLERVQETNNRIKKTSF